MKIDNVNGQALNAQVSSTRNHVSVAMLSKNLQAAEQNSTQLLKSLPTQGPQNSGIGTKLNILA